MNEHMWDEGIEQRVGTPCFCDQAEALVTYLYGEISGSAAKRFEQHLERCRLCCEELAALNRVRSSVGEWRTAALDRAAGAPLTYATPAASSVAAAPVQADEWHSPKRSTSAAWRQLSAFLPGRPFFIFLPRLSRRQVSTGSPLWLHAGSVAAAVVLCALVVFVVAYFERKPAETARLEIHHSEVVLRNEINVPAEEGAGREAPAGSNQQDKGRHSVVAPGSPPGSRSSVNPRATLSRGAKRGGAVQPSSASLPGDQRLTAENNSGTIAGEEAHLPHLYDLLGDDQLAVTEPDNSPRLDDLLREID